MPTTTRELADFGNRVAEAQAETREHERMELRIERQQDQDRRTLARVEPEIAAAEELIERTQLAVDKLIEQRNEAAARIEATATPSASDARLVEDIDEALGQALTAGAQIFRGVSVAEGGGETPKAVRIVHPRLLAADDSLDWRHPLAAVRRHVDGLKRERDGAARRLERSAAA